MLLSVTLYPVVWFETVTLQFVPGARPNYTNSIGYVCGEKETFTVVSDPATTTDPE